MQASHWPASVHAIPSPHAPQLPPQLSDPQTLPAQSAVHGSHAPAPEQAVPGSQAPQAPPQPSSPHVLPSQAGVQEVVSPGGGVVHAQLPHLLSAPQTLAPVAPPEQVQLEVSPGVSHFELEPLPPPDEQPAVTRLKTAASWMIALNMPLFCILTSAPVSPPHVVG